MIIGFETACLAFVHIGKDMATAVSMSIPPITGGKNQTIRITCGCCSRHIKNPFLGKRSGYYILAWPRKID